jgi:hypothetical protein
MKKRHSYDDDRDRHHHPSRFFSSLATKTAVVVCAREFFLRCVPDRFDNFGGDGAAETPAHYSAAIMNYGTLRWLGVTALGRQFWVPNQFVHTTTTTSSFPPVVVFCGA